MSGGIWFSKSSSGFRGWFQVVADDGTLRTGSAQSEFTFVVVSPDDSGSQEFFVSESQQKPGLYFSDIQSSYLLASGSGDYGVSVEIDVGLPVIVVDAFSTVLHVSQEDWDSLSGSLVDAIWDEPNSEHIISGSTGDSLLSGSNFSVSASVSVDNAAIAAAVWEEASGDHNTSGTMGWLQNQIIDAFISGSGLFISSASINQIVNAIWDEPNSEHIISGTVGDSLLSASSIVSVDNAAIADAVWDETASDHNVSGTMGYLQNQIEDEIISGSNLSVSIISSSIDSLVDAIWDEPNSEHLISGTTGDSIYSGSNSSVSASVSIDNTAIAAAVWDKLANDHNTTGTMGALQNQVEIIRALMENSWELSGSQMVFYGNDGTTPFRIYNLFDTVGDDFFSEANAPAKRELTGSLS